MYSMLRAYRVRALTVAGLFLFSLFALVRSEINVRSVAVAIYCSCFLPVGSKPDDGTVLTFFLREKNCVWRWTQVGGGSDMQATCHGSESWFPPFAHMQHPRLDVMAA